ncbi:MAG: homoserine dehydrogenase [Candidatus Methanofastidiosa archaeon]|nr:homoserine dehydrogenase [Candidatus Methanofastidiosa archaeon]HOM96194.1 homoserine dehydrogenase [Methanofastidiosum sp.]HPC80279.1 homoserine dehydrogenase [Methanofastidiosum sp.]HRS25713.1 homoserine dehydrogenase [Methanofastidiosum sp.]
MKKVRLGVVGFGIVGKGVCKVIRDKAEQYKKNYGVDVRIVCVADMLNSIYDKDGIDLTKLMDHNKERSPVINYPDSSKDKKWNGEVAVENMDADIVVEVTPTNIKDAQPGLNHIVKAFDRGMHVVTSNKGPLALYYEKVMKAKEESGKEFRYEATVGGTMPVINLAQEALKGNNIISVKGILNGTTNYILSNMAFEGKKFGDALKEAQEKGYAEANPAQDIEGWDAACKATILSNALMGKSMTLKDVKVKGITGVTMEEVLAAKNKGNIIKLLVEVTEKGAKVEPTPVPLNSPLAVTGTLNVAVFETDLSKDITVMGRGAGQIETAAAIMSDVFAIVK